MWTNSVSLYACFYLQNEDAVPNELTPMLGRSNSQASVFLYQSEIFMNELIEDQSGQFQLQLYQMMTSEDSGDGSAHRISTSTHDLCFLL